MGAFTGWLLVYLVGTSALMFFYSVGLSGWILDYPPALFIGIFVVLAVPLAMLVMKVPSAPTWNIAVLWAGVGLISVRILYGVVLMDRALQTHEALTMATIVTVGCAWAIAWTWYFLASERVARMFA